jgi:hypothetical protein
LSSSFRQQLSLFVRRIELKPGKHNCTGYFKEFWFRWVWHIRVALDITFRLRTFFDIATVF